MKLLLVLLLNAVLSEGTVVNSVSYILFNGDKNITLDTADLCKSLKEAGFNPKDGKQICIFINGYEHNPGDRCTLCLLKAQEASCSCGVIIYVHWEYSRSLFPFDYPLAVQAARDFVPPEVAKFVINLSKCGVEIKKLDWYLFSLGCFIYSRFVGQFKGNFQNAYGLDCAGIGLNETTDTLKAGDAACTLNICTSDFIGNDMPRAKVNLISGNGSIQTACNNFTNPLQKKFCSHYQGCVKFAQILSQRFKNVPVLICDSYKNATKKTGCTGPVPLDTILKKCSEFQGKLIYVQANIPDVNYC